MNANSFTSSDLQSGGVGGEDVSDEVHCLLEHPLLRAGPKGLGEGGGQLRGSL